MVSAIFLQLLGVFLLGVTDVDEEDSDDESQSDDTEDDEWAPYPGKTVCSITSLRVQQFC